MVTALDIAKYVITKCTEENEPISNLQLQKILYYVQYEFLQCNTIAFDDDFEARQFGPVVPSVYKMFCGFGALKIYQKYSMENRLDKIEIIDDVIVSKRKLAQWQLARDIHKTGYAWDSTYKNGLGNHKIISKDLIKTKGR